MNVKSGGVTSHQHNYTTKLITISCHVAHLWYNCRALAVTAIAVHRTIATAIVRRLDYG